MVIMILDYGPCGVPGRAITAMYAMPLAVKKVRMYFDERKENQMKEIPVWEKSNLTLEEAAAYSGIGINKLRELSNKEDCDFVLWISTKRLIKRKKLDEFIERCYSI